MIDEKIVKSKNKEWQKQTASKTKAKIRLYCDKGILNRRKKDVLFSHIERIIKEFTDQFDEEDKLIADEYHRELYSYARNYYQTFVDSMGNLPPNLYVLALADPNTLTKRQKDLIAVKAGVMRVNELSEASVKKLSDVYSKKQISASSYTHAVSAETYSKEVFAKIRKILKDEYSERGHSSNVNSRNIAEMNVRFEKYQSEKKRLKDKGVKLVYVPPHANCSKRCKPFQGLVYSLDGTSGTIDGRSYKPIENAAENVKYVSERTGNEYYNGLFSYNCRHSLKIYHRGQNIEQIPDDTIEKRRAIEETQRKMERRIRMLKEKKFLYNIAYDVEPNPSIKKKANQAEAKYKQLEKAYEDFSKKNEMPFYRERLEILDGEDIYLRNHKNDKIAKTGRKKQTI